MSPNVSDKLLSGVAEPITIIRVDKGQGYDSDPVQDVDHDRDQEECDCSYVTTSAVDAMFASLVVAPLVVGVWRGTWGLMDLHSDLFPYPQSYVLGILIHVCFALVRYHLLSRSQGAWSVGAGRWACERAVSRAYTVIFILSCIMHWRGGWGLLDSAVDTALPDPKDPHRSVMIAALLIMMYLCAVFLRSSRNILAPPYFLVTDGKEPTYIFTTRFRKQVVSSRETALFILDCVFSVCVVGSLVVFVWRGSWALLDLYLHPEDRPKSCWTSLIVGYALVVITFALQAPLRWAAARLRGAPKLLLADAYHLLAFAATVNVWRGVWGLLDIYLFPETPKLSNWLSHGVSLALLMLLNCSNSILVRGVYIDAEEPAGECVVFPCHYLRLYFHKQRTKKRHRQALAAAATAATRKSEDAALTPLQMPVVQEKV